MIIMGLLAALQAVPGLEKCEPVTPPIQKLHVQIQEMSSKHVNCYIVTNSVVSLY